MRGGHHLDRRLEIAEGLLRDQRRDVEGDELLGHEGHQLILAIASATDPGSNYPTLNAATQVPDESAAEPSPPTSPQPKQAPVAKPRPTQVMTLPVPAHKVKEEPPAPLIAVPKIDLEMSSFLCALVAISGLGGLTNSALSNYTREQGWGMGSQVGAIPSLVGGRRVQLSHVGMVFEPDNESMTKWRGWFRHLVRDQLAVWMPGCFVGVALPAMLSLMFLPRGFQDDDKWRTATVTADGVYESVGPVWGPVFWVLVLLCGFLVLGPSVTPATDTFLRRWVDVFWIASRRAHSLDPSAIRYVYFVVLAVYAGFGVTMLCLEKPQTLLFIATLLMNFALGASCLHTLYVNLTLLPRELRPGWINRIGLALSGIFFLFFAVLTTVLMLN